VPGADAEPPVGAQPDVDGPRGIPMRPPKPAPSTDGEEQADDGNVPRDVLTHEDAPADEDDPAHEDESATGAVAHQPEPVRDAETAEDLAEAEAEEELAGLALATDRRASTPAEAWPAVDLAPPGTAAPDGSVDEPAEAPSELDVVQDEAAAAEAEAGPAPAPTSPATPPTTPPPPPTRPTATGGGTGGDGGGRGRPPTEASSAGGPPEPPPPSEPYGLRQQFGRTRDAALGLAKAHIDLAQAELSEIMDEVKRLLVIVGVAAGLGIFVGILVSVGTTLWLGEWLFGSMAWGILHGTELSIGVVVALVVGYLGLSGRAVFGWLFVAAVIGILAGAVFGFQLFNQLWNQIGIALFPGLAPETRPLVVGAATMALIVGVLLFILGLRGGIGSAISGLIIGALLGALLGAFTAITFSWQVAAALGVAITLGLWPVFLALAMQRHGIDTEELKNRFYPNVTIETTKETMEWVRERTQRGQKS
jgi:hypothetical protein